MSLICFTIIFIVTCCFWQYGKIGDYKISKKYLHPWLLVGVILFSSFVGLRWTPNVDIDFEGYCNIVEMWDSHFYYSHIEFLPKLFIDVVNILGLPTYAWFVMMGMSLIVLTAISSIRFNARYLYFVFVWFILLYLSFDMNVVRQGVALSAFLCAVTYISEKNWKMYLLFAGIAFCFHRTSIVWSPAYLLTYINWDVAQTRKKFFIVLLTVLAMSALTFFMSQFEFVFAIMGMMDKLENVQAEGVEQNIMLGSGLGVSFRYVRWIFILFYIPKITKLRHSKEVQIMLFLFLIGAVMDPFSMLSISTGRIAMYPQYIEILLVAYLWEHSKVLKSGSVIRVVLILQMIVLLYQSSLYFSKWDFVSI